MEGIEQTIKDNYKRLLVAYHIASEHYQKTNDTELLHYMLDKLHTFETTFVSCYSFGELMELMNEMEAQGVFVH
ncbi:hypothetical protein NKR74_06265 [Bacillus sp. 3103sda1]|uniref:hypothetical protein n=1 Tax=Bacillus sp. 3103sda1 TaxID=2953808 RepID=UPI00209F1EF9|nr:hypothetical protein [Bacillus sp. 3103sda1]MCP1122941.1 hypothetical protein [Bacillus sp. 3103sda1]